MNRTLSEGEAWDVIKAGKVGRLGCIDDGEPYVVPINYLAEDGRIYSHSLPGRKIQALRKDGHACLQVDQIHDDFDWQSAIAFGEFEEIRDNVERVTVLRRLLERFPRLTPVESHLIPHAESEIVVFRLRVNRVTGVAEE